MYPWEMHYIQLTVGHSELYFSLLAHILDSMPEERTSLWGLGSEGRTRLLICAAIFFSIISPQQQVLVATFHLRETN